MANNKLVLGIGNEKNNRAETTFQDSSKNLLPIQTVEHGSRTASYENVWGNDYKLTKILDEKQLAERRLYTRALYLQRIECNKIAVNTYSEPIVLEKVLEFMVVDISMGGIGIVCEHELCIGTILYFNLIMDNISYQVNYEVVYCIPNDNRFRAGLKIVNKDKHFIRHLKILVARLSLQSQYGTD